MRNLKEYKVQNGVIESVKWFDGKTSATPNPMGLTQTIPGGYLRVEIRLHPVEKSNIGVVVCLPDEKLWNGRFLGTGNGGSAGAIADVSLYGGLSRGFAVANTDLGTTPDNDLVIGNEEALKDFGYRATHLMTEVGKSVTEFYYNQKISYAYFTGGSTGGQQAFSEAARYPEDYDGIVCLSPAMDRTRLHTFFVWNWQQIHKNKAAFTMEQAAAWRKCLEEEYGILCGNSVEENYLSMPHKIEENPMDNPNLIKKAKKLLSEGQIIALRNLYEGPKDPVTGERIFAHFMPGTETEGLGLVDLSDKEKFAKDLFFPFRWVWGKKFDFMKFDFHKDYERALKEIAPVLDSNSTDLTEFKKKGKLLVIGGSSDPIIPYNGFLDYYDKVILKEGGLKNTEEYFRFFLMPGLAHIMGGQGVQEVGLVGLDMTPRDKEHDIVYAMMEWVENDAAPEALYGTHFKMTEKGAEYAYDLKGYSYAQLLK